MAHIIYWTDEDSGLLVVVQFDATMSEEPEDVLTITEHPVEMGENVVDNARKEPTSISIEGFVSALPNPELDDDAEYRTLDLSVDTLGDPGTRSLKLDVPTPPVEISPSGLLQAGVGALTSLVTGGPNYRATVVGKLRRQKVTMHAQVIAQKSFRNRVRDVYEKLLDGQAKKVFCTVLTPDREYPDMMIARIAKPRAVEDGTGSKFQVDFKRVRIASSKTVQAPTPAELRGAVTKNKGAQHPKEDPASEVKSTLYSGGESVGIFP